MSKSILLLAVLCLAHAAMVQSWSMVYIYGSRIDDQAVPGTSSLNVWVSTVGSSVPIDPYVSNNVSLAYNLTEGMYTFHTNQPSFYHFKEDVLVETPHMYYTAPLVPVTSGVTILLLRSSADPEIVFGATNMTFPDGVFAFNNFSSTDPLPGRRFFGTGMPPSQFEYLYEALRFNNLEEGVYRLFSEARSQHGFRDGKVRFGVFAGSDEVTGLKTIVETANRTDINCNVGHITVVKPSSNCFRYSWTTVNTYSTQFGPFDLTAPGQPAIPLTEDCFDFSNPASLECVDLVYNDSNPIRTCGAFGDPHIIKFDSVGVTCSNLTALTLVDNEYFSLKATARFISPTNIATVFDSFTFTYKLPCNPISLTWTETSSPSIVNAPLAYRHRIYNYGRNMYYIDALHLQFQIRKAAPGGLTFGLSIPDDLISLSSGICTDSCPGFEQDINTKKRDAKSIRNAKLAAAACTDTGDYVYRACVFDVTVTGDAQFATVADEFATMKQEVSQAWTTPDAPPSWPAPTPDNPPTPVTSPSPPPSSPPSSSPSSSPVASPNGNTPTASTPTPTGSAAVIVPSIFVLIASLASLLF